jgi:hypothetical protein
VTLDLRCTACACTTDPADAAFCPDCGHAAALHSARKADTENETTKQRIEAWLAAGHSAVEVARLATEHELRWDGEDRNWAASNIAWFQRAGTPRAELMQQTMDEQPRRKSSWDRRRLMSGGIVIACVVFVIAVAQTLGFEDQDKDEASGDPIGECEARYEDYYAGENPQRDVFEVCDDAQDAGHLTDEGVIFYEDGDTHPE